MTIPVTVPVIIQLLVDLAPEVHLVYIATLQRFSIGIRLLADIANRILSLRWAICPAS